MLVKKFWLYAALFLLLVSSIIAYAIWLSSKPVLISPPTVSILEQDTPTQIKSPEQTSVETVPGHFPAPAKKLHQVIHSQADSEQSLEQKTQELDKKLADINEQLAAQGVTVPENNTEKVVLQNDTAKRLQAIKYHMQNKNSQ